MTRVILFDKDGTLMDYQKVWTPYAKRSIEAFAQEFDRHDINHLSFDLDACRNHSDPGVWKTARCMSHWSRVSCD